MKGECCVFVPVSDLTQNICNQRWVQQLKKQMHNHHTQIKGSLIWERPLAQPPEMKPTHKVLFVNLFNCLLIKKDWSITQWHDYNDFCVLWRYVQTICRNTAGSFMLDWVSVKNAVLNM